MLYFEVAGADCCRVAEGEAVSQRVVQTDAAQQAFIAVLQSSVVYYRSL